jgi:hypothetical protein
MVNQAWDENTITWNGQPTVSTSNVITVGATPGANSDMTGIDVTAPVQYWAANPSLNYGWRFWQVNEYTTLHSVEDFATPYDATPSYRPQLVVQYTCPAGIVNTAAEASISIYPNPTSDILFIKNAASGNFAVDILDLPGQKVLSETNNKEINTGTLASGTYMLHYTDLSTQKTTVIRFVKM